MKPITYEITGEMHGALIEKDCQSVCCGKCRSNLGKLSRLAFDEEIPEARQLPQEGSAYDPVLAQARARILGETKRAGIYLLLKAGYTQLANGLFALNTQSDKRSHDGRVLRKHEEGMLKEADRIWPEGKQLFVGSVRYYFYNVESQGPFKETWLTENDVVFDIFGSHEQIAATHKALSEKWSRERQEDLQNKWKAESLRENAQHIAKRRSEDLFLQPPPVSVEEGYIPVRCWRCTEDNILSLKALATSFEDWEAKMLEKKTTV